MPTLDSSALASNARHQLHLYNSAAFFLLQLYFYRDIDPPAFCVAAPPCSCGTGLVLTMFEGHPPRSVGQFCSVKQSISSPSVPSTSICGQISLPSFLLVSPSTDPAHLLRLAPVFIQGSHSPSLISLPLAAAAKQFPFCRTFLTLCGRVGDGRGDSCIRHSQVHDVHNLWPFRPFRLRLGMKFPTSVTEVGAPQCGNPSCFQVLAPDSAVCAGFLERGWQQNELSAPRPYTHTLGCWNCCLAFGLEG